MITLLLAISFTCYIIFLATDRSYMAELALLFLGMLIGYMLGQMISSWLFFPFV